MWLVFLYTIPLGTCKEAKPVEQGVKTSHTPKLAELKKIQLRRAGLGYR